MLIYHRESLIDDVCVSAQLYFAPICYKISDFSLILKNKFSRTFLWYRVNILNIPLKDKTKCVENKHLFICISGDSRTTKAWIWLKLTFSVTSRPIHSVLKRAWFLLTLTIISIFNEISINDIWKIKFICPFPTHIFPKIEIKFQQINQKG